jgi:hypothetical protein
VIAVDKQQIQPRTVQPLVQTSSRFLEMGVPFDTHDVLVVMCEQGERGPLSIRKLPIDRYQGGV